MLYYRLYLCADCKYHEGIVDNINNMLCTYCYHKQTGNKPFDFDIAICRYCEFPFKYYAVNVEFGTDCCGECRRFIMTYKTTMNGLLERNNFKKNNIIRYDDYRLEFRDYLWTHYKTYSLYDIVKWYNETVFHY